MLHVKGPLVLQQRLVVLNGVLWCLISIVLNIMISIPVIVCVWTLFSSLRTVVALIVFFSTITQMVIITPA
jgi:hypothetical protein